MDKLYRVNPFCPKCGEEHAYFIIQISDEEQRILDAYYRAHEMESSLSLLLENPPLIVNKTFKCPVCRTEFTKFVAVRRENKVGYNQPGTIPLGIVPILEEN